MEMRKKQQQQQQHITTHFAMDGWRCFHLVFFFAFLPIFLYLFPILFRFYLFKTRSVRSTDLTFAYSTHIVISV